MRKAALSTHSVIGGGASSNSVVLRWFTRPLLEKTTLGGDDRKSARIDPSDSNPDSSSEHCERVEMQDD